MAPGQKRHPHMKPDKAGAAGQKYVHDEGFRPAVIQEQEEADSVQVAYKRLNCPV